MIVQVAPRDRSRPNDISDIYVRARDGSMVQLGKRGQRSRRRVAVVAEPLSALRAVTITANLAPGYTIGDAEDDGRHGEARAAAGCADRPERPVARVPRARGGFYLTLALALIFIYLVLAAQFESFADPFVIMLSVPLSMAGALFALWATGGTWNIYSQIGVITLVGLITKHGILIVEFANQLQERGGCSIALRHSASCGCGRS